MEMHLGTTMLKVGEERAIFVRGVVFPDSQYDTVCVIIIAHSI